MEAVRGDFGLVPASACGVLKLAGPGCIVLGLIRAPGFGLLEPLASAWELSEALPTGGTALGLLTAACGAPGILLGVCEDLGLVMAGAVGPALAADDALAACFDGAGLNKPFSFDAAGCFAVPACPA